MAKSIPVLRQDRRRLNRRTRRRPVARAFVLSPAAKARLAMPDWHRAHGGNVARTARHFGFSRPTVYRWLAATTGPISDRSRIVPPGRIAGAVPPGP